MMRSLLILCLLSCTLRSPDYEAIFGQDYQAALSWVGENQGRLRTGLGEEPIYRHMLPVLFPEVIRYSLLRDFFETQSLELLYVNFGSGYADFSIGRFQMKPSFAEQIEGYLSRHPGIGQTFPELISYEEAGITLQREARLNRLQDLDWQLKYAQAFYQILLHRFPKLVGEDPEEKVRFMAAAYNAGFTKPEESILTAASAACFPYGPRYPGRQYAYSEIAADFLARHFQNGVLE